MPVTKTIRKQESRPAREQEEAEGQAAQPVLEPAEDRPVAPGRPHQAFVESRLRQYLQDNNVQSLVKPAQEEIRAAAMPILCQARRRRTGREPLDIALRAVAAMVHHARKERWTKLHLTDVYEDPGLTYIDGLIRLAEEAFWLGRRIPLPQHTLPYHPPIYYTINPERNRLIPRADALIRADYVREFDGSRATQARHFHPWLSEKFTPESFTWGENAYYTLVLTPENDVEVILHWAIRTPWCPDLITMTSCLSEMYFSPRP